VGGASGASGRGLRSKWAGTPEQVGGAIAEFQVGGDCGGSRDEKITKNIPEGQRVTSSKEY